MHPRQRRHGRHHGARRQGCQIRGRNHHRHPLNHRSQSPPTRYIDYAIPTPLGFVRNVLVANASDAVIALPGKWGTSNELSFAMIAGVPVVALEGWEVNLRDDGGKSRFTEVPYARDAAEAVTMAIELARQRRA